eukprot:746532-Hanusia_phi.AAC.1
MSHAHTLRQVSASWIALPPAPQNASSTKSPEHLSRLQRKRRRGGEEAGVSGHDRGRKERRRARVCEGEKKQKQKQKQKRKQEEKEKEG